ncbi:uncharacterized protein PGTG_11834 [Puccinia graminis f. sp. tritici CRL 75-36-700-3]|uniref:Uncharacterized protein n=1 Tax=Puccinia graminis f. sp. tritici (strain CRL 75-36-700-3 / race SCCL) TaxID=418459 RepID=E3KMF3_PUCGT|nr:uncharacterized protein PGTG_11834 [Puccinia graminis f. sp. tritici CRL 75-36-700-3]EFP85478.2 hypothetical protein PGTG_11834 [Puccinia graminis f. sp. tritici CRL 75-36-700-3]
MNNPKPKTVEAKILKTNLFSEDQDENYIFENENLSAEPTVDRLDLREFSVENQEQEVIWDSGASDNVTGDRHIEKPIPVRVATDSASDFITGLGTLKFAGPRKTTVRIRFDPSPSDE